MVFRSSRPLGNLRSCDDNREVTQTHTHAAWYKYILYASNCMIFVGWHNFLNRRLSPWMFSFKLCTDAESSACSRRRSRKSASARWRLGFVQKVFVPQHASSDSRVTSCLFNRTMKRVQLFKLYLQAALQPVACLGWSFCAVCESSVHVT